jgi:CDP-glycerol glycerophosphotransferase (TagB/SpsB family)
MRNIISKPVVAAGMAKLDGLFSGRIRRESVLERYGLPAGFRYVLFAPTFNDELSAIPFVMDGINRVLTDNDTLLLIKLHGSTKAEYKDMYRDLVRKDPRVVYADELDITPFLALADVMISDVSSSMMEFAALDKPVVLFDNPRWSSYRNYNPDDIEFSWRDIGIRVRSLEEMREAVARSLRYPAEFAERRRFYTDRLFANKLDGSAAERIVSRSFELFGKERASMPL